MLHAQMPLAASDTIKPSAVLPIPRTRRAVCLELLCLQMLIIIHEHKCFCKRPTI